MKIIVIGLIGAGKDVFSEYVSRKYGYKIITMGDFIRELALSSGRTASREDLHKTQKEYREKYSPHFFGDLVVKRIKENRWENVVINGARLPEDVEAIKNGFGKDLVTILIETKQEKRFERLKKRGTARDPHTFEEFLRQEKNELSLFRLKRTMKMAEYKIDNNSTLKEFYKRIDNFMSRHKLKQLFHWCISPVV